MAPLREAFIVRARLGFVYFLKVKLRKIVQPSVCVIRLFFAYNTVREANVGLNIGGYEDRPDWPKMGPSLLISTCLILAIRTAKWPARSSDSTASNMDLEKEIEHAAYLAGRVFARLVSKHPSIFPNRKKPWYQPDGEDQPK